MSDESWSKRAQRRCNNIKSIFIKMQYLGDAWKTECDSLWCLEWRTDACRPQRIPCLEPTKWTEPHAVWKTAVVISGHQQIQNSWPLAHPRSGPSLGILHQRKSSSLACRAIVAGAATTRSTTVKNVFSSPRSVGFWLSICERQMLFDLCLLSRFQHHSSTHSWLGTSTH